MTAMRSWKMAENGTSIDVHERECTVCLHLITQPIRSYTGELGLRVPQSKCPPACKLPIRILRAQYRFIP